MDLLNSIDFLKSLLDTEAALRQAANVEWSKGIHDGPMKAAHDSILQQIKEAAKNLASIA